MSPGLDHASQLAQRLEYAVRDTRLERVGGIGQTCTMTLWLLELSLPAGTEHRMAYAWVLPSAGGSLGWSAADGGKRKGLGGENGVRYRVPRVNCTGDATHILAFFQSLLRGATLTEAAESAGLPALTEQVQPYATLRLPPAGSPRTPVLAVRPPVMLHPEEGSGAAPSRWSSLLPDAPTLVAAIVLLDKSRLWNIGAIPPEQRLILARALLLHMTQETGLAFVGPDASRLGNVEWIAALGADEDGEPLIDVDFVREERRAGDDNVTERGVPSVRAVIARIDPLVAPVGTEVMVRCRLINEEVLDDQLQSATLTAQGVTLAFSAAEELSLVELTVWRRQGERFILAAERRVTVIRRAEIDMRMISASGTLRSKWLEAFDRERAVSTRAARMAAFQQGHSVRVSAGGYDLDPWHTVQSDADALTESLFPPDSGARYFSREGQGEAPLLEFAEWLREFTADGGTGRLLIVDPYFGSFGLDLLSRAVRADVKYQVLTCTQLRTEDGDDADTCMLTNPSESQATENVGAAEPRRANELHQTLERLRPVIAGLDLEIFDLRKDGLGRSASFHDRFVLVYDREDELRAGFNLSNSLQGATRRYPLLALPIRRPILDEVATYAAELMAGRPPGLQEVAVVSIKLPRPPLLSSRDLLYEHAAKFDARLFEQPELVNASSERRVEILGTLDVRRNESVDISGVMTKLRELSATFGTLDNVAFLTLWLDFSAWCATSHVAFEARAALVEGWTPALEERLRWALTALLDLPAPLGPADSLGSLNVLGLMVLEGDKAFRLAGQLLRNPEPVFKAYAVQDVVRLLARCAPQVLVQILDTMRPSEALLSQANTPDGYARSAWWEAVLHVLLKRLRFQREDDLVSALFGSTQPLLRALALYALIRAVAAPRFPTIAWPEALELFDRSATPDLRPEALAQWLLELRRVAPQGGTEEGAEQLRSALYERLESALPQSLTAEELEVILRRIGEPGIAPSVTACSLVQPLVNRGVVTADAVASAWLLLIMPDIEAWAFNENRTERVRFNVERHGPVTLLAAQAFLAASPTLRNDWTKRLNKAVAAAGRTVQRTWARARGYQEWQYAWLGLMWAEVFVLYVLKEAAENDTALESNVQALAERLLDLTASVPTIQALWPEDLAQLSSGVAPT